ncbi:hypothetical protein RZS08_39815, partial [Arthrospira platensis SPKY1]|nr:hypothetical protein [Arthrospira platensis SPKY1]
MKGTVIKSTGSWYQVKLDNGQVIPCRIVGKIKLDDLKLTNPVAVGDYVEVDFEENLEKGLIKSIYPRINYVLRQSPRKKHQ